MERWYNKLAIITGASSGIGAACVKALLSQGLRVLGLARTKSKLQEFQETLSESEKSQFVMRQCDVTKEHEIIETFEWAERNLNGIDILINNAGIVKQTELVRKNNTKEICQVMNTNILGVMWCTREAFHYIHKRNTEGHIFIINSIAGKQVLNFIDTLPSFNIYPATKYALSAMTETYRQEFQLYSNKIRITGICPGAVNTKLFPKEIQSYVNGMALLEPSNIGDAVLYALRTPSHVHVHDITLKPMGEAF